jgi:hypothetical protein
MSLHTSDGPSFTSLPREALLPPVTLNTDKLETSAVLIIPNRTQLEEKKKKGR